MEFFHGVNIDWMGKAKYFATLSLILLAVGWTSVFLHHGLEYGIDFRGGTVVDVRFAGNAPALEIVSKIRNALDSAGVKNNSVKSISDPLQANSRNDVEIGLEQAGQTDQELDATRGLVMSVLYKSFGGTNVGKADFNRATAPGVAAYLTQQDPLHLGAMAGARYQQLAAALISARDSQHNGIVTKFGELSNVPGVNSEVVNALSGGYSLANFTILTANSIGPTVGQELRRKALWATLYALGGMLIYVAIRFSGGDLFVRGAKQRGTLAFLGRVVDKGIFGAAAVIACFHDVLITLGFFSLAHYEISLTVIAALLTLVGYSMNDTIVIFDRVRENLRLMRREPFPQIVNTSINQTLSRTILTSGLTLLTVLVLYLLGGEPLRAFSFAMVIGVVVGTYSSFGIAAPIVVVWNKFYGKKYGSSSGSAVVASARKSARGGDQGAVRAGTAAGPRAMAAARR